MWEKIKEGSYGVLGCGGLIVMISLVVVFLEGAVYIGERILPFLASVVGWLTLLFVVILLPLGFIKRTKSFAGKGTFFFSYISGFTLWFYAALVTYYLWGFLALFIGLALAGVGVLPVAILAALFQTEWGIFGYLVYLSVITYGARMLGLYWMTKAEEQALITSHDSTSQNTYGNRETEQYRDAEVIEEDEKQELFSEGGYCTNCGKPFSEEAIFCRYCGNKKV